MIDKNFCMSSYLTFRYVEREDMEFAPNFYHKNCIVYPNEKKIVVSNANEMAIAYKKIIEEAQSHSKVGLLLSGGMDSACLVPFLKPNTDAYTFRFLGGTYGKDELKRAEYYAKKYKLNLHYVDIDFSVVQRNLIPLMKEKGAPVHSIEPQLMEAAIQAKKDGIEQLICADNSDAAFGGYDKMLSKDWEYEEWKCFYTFLDPSLVLKNPVDMDYLYRRYRLPNNKVNVLAFIDEVFAHESNASYQNAIDTAKMKLPILDPTDMVKMGIPLDIERVRNGESKYLVRELFSNYYPEIKVPEKIPMPRPVDSYFKDWNGPTRNEFKDNINMSKLSGNQKWQLYCLERFLNMIDNR